MMPANGGNTPATGGSASPGHPGADHQSDDRYNRVHDVPRGIAAYVSRGAARNEPITTPAVCEEDIGRDTCP